MKGAYDIKVGTKRVEYNIRIKRNITIIRGDSATGKSTLISLINRYYENGAKSGVKLQCDKVCMVVGGRNWQKLLAGVHDTIVFIDEGNNFIKSHDFSRIIQETNNYYVLITREDIKGLPYSINEIYGLRITRNKREAKKVYNEMYCIYNGNRVGHIIKPSLVITEDSNSGFDFFKYVCNRVGIKCIPGNGRETLVDKIITRDSERSILLIADGAAYGCAMSITLEKLGICPNYSIYLPESFEWLLLKSNVIKYTNIDDILTNTHNYVESSKYFSWERFFTDIIEHAAKESDYIKSYNKSGYVPSIFKQPENMQKVLSVIPSNIVFKQ